LTILLDCDAETGLLRTKTRAENAVRVADRFEGELFEFHQRVREGFRMIARDEPLRIVLLDSARETNQVSADVLRLVLQWLSGRQ